MVAVSAVVAEAFVVETADTAVVEEEVEEAEQISENVAAEVGCLREREVGPK
jgi:hypothetical protein